MGYKIGDKVIHWSYGLGEIVRIEEKDLHGHRTKCYVVDTKELIIWIPIDQANESSLRLPTPSSDFDRLFAILSGPGEPLPADRLLRKDQLRSQMKDGQLASICRVIRDMEFYKHSAKLNDQETAMFALAKKSLLAEWTYSRGETQNQAQSELTKLLEINAPPRIEPSAAKKRAPKPSSLHI